RCTYVFVAPPVAVALAKHPLVNSSTSPACTPCSPVAAPLYRSLGEAVSAAAPCKVRQGYGMSEMSPVSHVIPFDGDDVPLDSVGPTPRRHGVQARRPEHRGGSRLPIGEGNSEPGELWCKGPNVMLGYLGNPQATADALDADGYLHTGDIATVDAAATSRSSTA
ncbi:AMP-binding protein, partial [Rhodococcus hoagii]|nr:AMP-binding protein [Prescottella equi]